MRKPVILAAWAFAARTASTASTSKGVVVERVMVVRTRRMECDQPQNYESVANKKGEANKPKEWMSYKVRRKISALRASSAT
jgi:hypothetical protein